MEAQQNPPSVNPDYSDVSQSQYPSQAPLPEQPSGYQPPYQQQYSQYPPHPSQPQGYPQQPLYPQMPPQGYVAPNPGPEMAVIVCYSCGHENIVPMTVLSLSCARCGAPNEKPKPPSSESFSAPPAPPAPEPHPPAFIPNEVKEAVKEEIKERKMTYLSDFQPQKETKFEIADLGPPFFFPSMREWKWKIMCKGVLEFELELKYEPRHCQEDLSLIRRGKLIAVATYSFGKYKIQTPDGDNIAYLTINKGLLGGGDGQFVLSKPMGPMSGTLRVHIARMGTHKLFEGERMVTRWGQEHSNLTIEVEEKTDAALMLFAVCCFQRWG